MIVGEPRRRTTARSTNHAASSDGFDLCPWNEQWRAAKPKREEHRQEESFATERDEQCSSILNRPRGRSDPTRDKPKALPSTGRADRNRSASARQPDAQASAATAPSQMARNNTK